MRIKSLAIVIVLNVALSIFLSIVLEYVNLTLRVQNAENTIQSCLDAALDISTASEELFTEKAQSEMASIASYGQNYVYNGSDTSISGSPTIGNHVYARTILYMDNRFRPVNSYQLARYYDAHGELPKHVSQMSALDTEDDQMSKIYNFLFGSPGQDYTHSGLEWANKSTAKRKDYNNAGISGTRTANPDFKEFYNEIGEKQETVGYLKKHSGDSYVLELKKYPALVNMGLKLHAYNETGSSYTDDNFAASYHVGKAYLGTRKTRYYLTPTSLGVTYVPVKVLKPLFIANLDTMCRLQRLSGGQISAGLSDTKAKEAINSVDGCIPTDVYTGGIKFTSGGKSHATHTTAVGEKIINNGDCEFDINSVKVKVDYFLVDFLVDNNTSRVLASKLNGMLNNPSGGGLNAFRQYTLARFNNANVDTGTKVKDTAFKNAYNSIRMKRIVARVSVKMKLHLPYKSPYMQWFCQLSHTSPHYDMKMFDASTGKVDMSSNGVWYKYTTYYCQTR